MGGQELQDMEAKKRYLECMDLDYSHVDRRIYILEKALETPNAETRFSMSDVESEDMCKWLLPVDVYKEINCKIRVLEKVHENFRKVLNDIEKRIYLDIKS